MASAWILLSLLSAFSLATSDAFTKRTLGTCNEYLAAWFRLLFSIPILSVLLIVIPRPYLDSRFFSAFALALPLELISVILYIKALRLSPLSLTIPFLSLTPVFSVVISYLLLGEKVSPQGVAGIFFLAAGSYMLQLHHLRNGILDPIRAIAKEKGALLMISVALIYSITSPLGKVAITHSSPLFFSTTYIMCLTILFTPVALWKGRHDIKIFVQQQHHRRLVVPGIFYALMVVSHMTAISLTKVAYMISLKRTSVLISVLYGYFLFREKNIKERLAGAIIMTVGFMIIVMAE